MYYTYSEDKSIAFVEGKRCPSFAVNKGLSAREWLPLMGITLPSTMISGEFLALIKKGGINRRSRRTGKRKNCGFHSTRDSEGRAIFPKG